MNEGNSNFGSETESDLDSISLASEEDFAGKKTNKILISRKKYLIKFFFFIFTEFLGSKTPSISEGNLTIRSHRGTVRGVKHRVRAGIATFLRDPSSKVIIF